MARKPPVSYAAMELSGGEGEGAQEPVTPLPPITPPPRPTKPDGRTLKEVSAHIMTYIHPDAAKALKRYAVENNCKVHDLCIEALEDWFRAHGLRERVKADPRKPEPL
jgi:hypothetical protein